MTRITLAILALTVALALAAIAISAGMDTATQAMLAVPGAGWAVVAVGAAVGVLVWIGSVAHRVVERDFPQSWRDRDGI